MNNKIIIFCLQMLNSSHCRIGACDALPTILEVHDDASDFTISLRWPENKHDSYKNYNNLVSKWMITIIVLLIIT